MMRHLALAFPDSPVSWGRGRRRRNAAARFECMFGGDLLVAPVVDMGATGRDVWLPPGEWVDLLGRRHLRPRTGSYDAAPAPARCWPAPGSSTSTSPLGRTPLFVQAGTRLPMLPADVDTLDDGAGFANDDRGHDAVRGHRPDPSSSPSPPPAEQLAALAQLAAGSTVSLHVRLPVARSAASCRGQEGDGSRPGGRVERARKRRHRRR